VIQKEQLKKRWVDKGIDQLENIALRISLLAIIKIYQDHNGIHGYDIGTKLYEMTDGVISGSKATYYAILRRLELDNLLTARIKKEKGPVRKYYFLTTDGEKALNLLSQAWYNYDYVIKNLLDTV
jgi:PadR family transcriptional regulator PadR